MTIHRRETLSALLVILVMGVARISLTPLWANAEEPYHFIRLRTVLSGPDPDVVARLEEQIRGTLLVNDPRLGLIGLWDNARLREAQAGGQTYGVGGSGQPVGLGNPQFDEPALYYLILTPWLLPIQNASLATQLNAARLGTLMLGLVVIALTAQIAQTVFWNQPALRRGLPLVVAVLPQFVKTMTMVNDTALAVAAVTLTLWALSRTLRPEMRFRDGVGLVAAGGLCVLSKTIALVGWVAVVWGALWLTRRWITVLTSGLAGCLLVALVAAGIAPIGARNWYLPQTPQLEREAAAPEGLQVVRLDAQQLIWQALPLDQVEQVAGKNVVFSAWTRGDGLTPQLWAAGQDAPFEQFSPSSFQPSSRSTRWTQVQATIMLPQTTRCVVLLIKNQSHTPAWVDDVWLMAANPEQNILANGSFELPWVTLRPEIEHLLPARLAERNLILVWRIASLTEGVRQHSLLNTVIHYLFTTFWGWFGWVAPSLPVATVALLAFSVLAAAAGWIRGLRLGQFSAEQRFFIIGSALVGLGAVMLAIASLEPATPFAACDTYQGRTMPTAYYLAPATVPLLAVWMAGLTAWVPKRWRGALIGGLVFGLFLIGLQALLQTEIPSYLQALKLLP